MSKIVNNSRAKQGDGILLSKPLGTQPAMAALRVALKDQEALIKEVPASIISKAIDKAIEVMQTTNNKVAEIMVEARASAATDVTGFGCLGHSEIMAKRSCVDIILHTLPVIKGTVELSKVFGYGLESGVSTETSGVF